MKIVLNKADVIEKARAAFLRGELQCQQDGFIPDSEDTFFLCSYSGPCAIGASLSEEQRSFLDRQDAPRIRSLWYDGHIECSREEMLFLDELQTAHDTNNVSALNELLGIDF